MKAQSTLYASLAENMTNAYKRKRHWLLVLAIYSSAHSGEFVTATTQDIFEATSETFIKHNLCRDSTDCDKHGYMSWHGTLSGTIIEFHNITDSEIISEVIGECIQLRSQSKDKSPLTIYFEKARDPSSRSFFRFSTIHTSIDTFIEVDLAGEQQGS